jgi:hypothetical protein
MTVLDKYRVPLTTQERADLDQVLSRGKAAARKRTRARLRLLADDCLGGEHSADAIVAALGASPRTVSRVRRPLVTEGFDVALCRRPQPRRPDTMNIKGDIDQRLVELACSDPAPGRCHGTVHRFADELVALGGVARLGLATVRLALEKTIARRGSSRPGASRRTRPPSSSGAWRT